MRLKLSSRKRILINITSLIDVLFLLLIFLLVSSTFLEQPGIKLELPAAESSEALEQKDYVLSITRNGEIYLNSEVLNLENIEMRIRRALPDMKEQALLLKADQDISHGLVVKVMDLVKKGGVKKLIVATRTEEEKP